MMPQRWTRRALLGAAAASSMVGLLAACGGSASVAATTSVAGSAATSAAASSAASASAAATSAAAASAATSASASQATTAASSSAAASAASTAAAAAPAGQTVTIALAHWQTGVSAQLFNKVYDRFQQLNPTIKIKQEVAPFDQHFQRLLVGFAGGSAPDCFHNSGAYFLQFAKKGVMLDLSPFVTSQKIDFTGTWTEDDEMKYQGKWYSMPTWNTDDLLYYNKSAFSKAGVAEPTDDWTWNDMLAAAQKLTTKTADGKVDVWGVQIPNGVQGGWGAMIYANGGDWMNADRTKTTLDQPAALGALQFIDDLMRKYKVMPTAVDNQALTQAGITDPFASGKLAMYTAITSNIPTYLKNAKFEWDVALIPKSPNTGKNGSTYIIQPSSASKTTKYADQSFALLAFQMSAEAQQILATDKTKFIINIATAKDAQKGFSAPPPAHVARAVTTMSFAQDLRFIEPWAEYQQKIDDQLAKAYLGQASMADAAKSAVAAGDQVLAQSS